MPPPRQSKVKVYMRTRPCDKFANDMIEFGTDSKSINIYNRNKTANQQAYVNNQITDWSFRVDGILHNATQESVYNQVVRDITLQSLEGYNGTVMCYGQTGAGKTFTMTGATENYQERGLIPRTIQHIFKEIKERQDRAYTVRIGYLEIYNEQLFDLLSTIPPPGTSELNNNSSTLSVYDDRGDIFVKGLSYQLATCEEEALNLLFEGETNRAIGAHVLNKESSRSHCIFTIRIESKSLAASNEKYTLSKLNLVDLAGSERLAKTQSQGLTQKEAQYINKSLSFLEQAVIGLCDAKKPFVQFRQCKLTHVLKDSIGGHCMTTMVANIWPEARHMEETVSTLRFSSRMMNVPVEPALNEIIDPVRMMQKLDSEVKALRQELAMHDTLANRGQQIYEPLSEHQLLDLEQQCRQYVEGKIDDIEVTNLRQIQAIFAAFKRICKHMEKDVEQKIREKYTMIDKTDVDQIAQAQKAGLPIADDGSLVGESDGQSFGIGLAPNTSRANKEDLLRATQKQRRTRQGNTRTPPPPADPTKPPLPQQQQQQQQGGGARGSRLQQQQIPAPPTMVADPTAVKVETMSPASGTWSQLREPQRAPTPPPKNIAFEEFKVERGNEINRIWIENKEILSGKRRQYSDLAHRINETKAQIDQTRMHVERKRTERAHMGDFVNELGETVIDEEEFALIKRLQELKAKYRDDFDKWRELKAEIVYCQNLVEQCRQRLIQEFDSWYNETYLSNGHPMLRQPMEPKYGSAAIRQYEDAAERFERMQREILANDIDSMPYHTARLKNERRHHYNDALEKASHHYLTSMGSSSTSSASSQFGAPIRRLSNPPPGKLTVS